MKDTKYGDKLKNYYKVRGWNRKYVHENCNIPLNTLWAWEESRRIPPLYVQELVFYRLDRLGLPEYLPPTQLKDEIRLTFNDDLTSLKPLGLKITDQEGNVYISEEVKR